MKLKFKTVKNDFPKMEQSLRLIEGKNITVGVKGEHAWLASIHEYGCTIEPKRAKYLTVPCNRKAYGKKASDFNDLFFLELPDGSKWLARDKGSDQLEFMFALMKSVKIPERSFLRSGFDACHLKAIERGERVLPLVLDGRMKADDMYEVIGTILRDGIKDFANDLSSPEKSPLTIEANGGKENPLVDTGDMIGSIEFEVTD